MAGASVAPPPGPSAAANRYDAASAVQVLGAGSLDDSEMRALSAQERGKLAM